MFDLFLFVGGLALGFGAGASVARKGYTGRFFGPVPADKPADEATPPASPK